jgi:RimJ/RimL family protein N-acetyltransferase
LIGKVVPLQQSTRIELLPFSLTDADELFVIRSDAEAMRHWDWPADKTADETRQAAQDMLRDVENGTARIWTVRTSAARTFVGVVDLSEIDGGSADLGFMIRHDYWGKGFAFGAATLAVLNGWTMGLAALRARIHADNVRSRRLLTRLGFRPRETRNVEIRPGVVKACEFFRLEKPRQGSSSLSQ